MTTRGAGRRGDGRAGVGGAGGDVLEAVEPSTVSFTLKDSGGNAVAGTVGFNDADTVATFTPDSSLAGNTTYTATVSGARKLRARR